MDSPLAGPEHTIKDKIQRQIDSVLRSDKDETQSFVSSEQTGSDAAPPRILPNAMNSGL